MCNSSQQFVVFLQDKLLPERVAGSGEIIVCTGRTAAMLNSLSTCHFPRIPRIVKKGALLAPGWSGPCNRTQS